MRNFNLREEAGQHLLLVAHRGVSGGNVPCNTLASFQAALLQRTDMIELDVGRSKDGTLYVFHEGCEKAHLKTDQRLCEMTDAEVARLRFVNQDDTPTEHPVHTLDEAFDFLKGRCYINIDKFSAYPAQIIEAVRRHDIMSQVVVKTPQNDMKLDILESLAPDMPYIVIVTDKDTVSEKILRRNINFVGIEAVFTSEESPLASEGYRDSVHGRNLLLWGNSIVYNYKSILSAGHTDDVSIAGNPDAGWGWLAKAGFDIIQTDWPLQAHLYLVEKGLYFKNGGCGV